MKHIIITILALIFVLALLYSGIAFYYLTFNPSKWSESARQFFSVFGFLGTIIVIGASIGMYIDLKKLK
ncbi:hypothetical protein [Chryseobacterium sp. 2VB]|uniref:hypothetical protein n=1 Tax=Chryseobacterium sp. 2VB TaxID=2502204 RepID=UPI0010F6769D|nr:hypothetical protein [Chryseobacterium sp. 2VB]